MCNPKKENKYYKKKDIGIETNAKIKNNTISQETMASGRFMRGTDPIKSTWEYPNLIL